jgi:Holliday junction DNA helicase RuvA
MIASLRGTVMQISEDSLVIEVGGVGLQVFAPQALCGNSSRGELISLHTHLVVREDSLTLFGFESAEEKEFFVLMLGVSGIGPRLALASLSTLNPDSIRRAVFHEQPEVFSRIPGVGKKTAQKVLLHLQDRIQDVDDLAPVAAMDDVDTEVMDALVALGYSIVEAQAALQSLPKDAEQDIEVRLRIALQYFSS